MPAWLTLKLGGMILGGLAVVALLWIINGWRVDAAERKAKLEVICQTTRTASGQPKLKCADVPKQIQFMGEAFGTLSAAIDKQNAAVKAMGTETARQQSEAAKASETAQARARGAEATAERLRASARSTVPSKVCEPSKTLQEAWR